MPYGRIEFKYEKDPREYYNDVQKWIRSERRKRVLIALSLLAGCLTITYLGIKYGPPGYLKTLGYNLAGIAAVKTIITGYRTINRKFVKSKSKS